ncbi:MAG: GGDEF domain-containing protein [candidate division WOR-3 bacterium]
MNREEEKGQLIKDLKELRKRLSGLSETVDKLTGLCNKEYFIDLAECEFLRALRFQRPLSLILISIKDFELIKSQNGSEVAYNILKEVANRCSKKVRELDYFGRYDEDKLVLLLPEADKFAIQKVAERLQEVVRSSPIVVGEQNFNVSLCQGGVELSEKYKDLQEFLKEGEEALKEAQKREESFFVAK